MGGWTPTQTRRRLLSLDGSGTRDINPFRGKVQVRSGSARIRIASAGGTNSWSRPSTNNNALAGAVMSGAAENGDRGSPEELQRSDREASGRTRS